MVTVAPRNFVDKKSRILSALAVPDTQYNDLSPKGTVDAPIRALIDQINQRPGCVTTSSCSGRIAVYLEGGAQGDAGGQTDGDDATEVTSLSSGMKGGGRWLYVSHDPVELGEYSDEELCAMLGLVRVSKEKHDVHSARTRWIHLKFEPFILHLLTASLVEAQVVLTSAEQAGFRESGARGLTNVRNGGAAATPMVAVRSMGIALATLIGYFDEETEKATCHVSGGQLRALLELANLRFAENARRVERFRAGLTGIDEVGAGKGVEWEDADARRARKRAEGLQRAQEARREKETLEETKTPLEVAFEDDEHGGENV